MEKARDYQFDNMKAILIFLVVLGHVLSRFGDSQSATTLYKIIFSFHMPAFLFVSGYFAKFNPKKLFSTLFPLYILFQLIQIFENFAIQWITTGARPELTVDLFPPKWTLWYLVALMLFQLLIPLFDTENRKKRVGLLVAALALGFLIGFFLDGDNLFPLPKLIVFLPFFMLGYYERKNGLLRAFGRDYFKIPAKILAVIVGAGMIVAFCLWGSHVDSSWMITMGRFTDPTSMIFRILLYVMGFLWIMILLIWVPKRPMGYVKTIGKNTLAVYLLHTEAILILEQTVLKAWIGTNLLTLLVAAAVLTLALSWNGFERFVKAIRIPYSKKQTVKE